MNDRDTQGVLFVCLGNICRSPLAEGIFIQRARKRGVLDRYRVDSAGTGHWHVGRPADPRSIEVGQRHGIELPSIGRQVNPMTDFENFAHILAMDRSNRDDLLDLGAPTERVRLYRSFDPELSGAPDDQLDVPDPYYGEGDGFLRVYEMLVRATEGFFDDLEEK